MSQREKELTDALDVSATCRLEMILLSVRLTDHVAGCLIRQTSYGG
jgi:hypothetical protein